jgi:hypothetical protein
MTEPSQELNKLLIAKDDVELKLLDSAEEHSVMLDVISEKVDALAQENENLKDYVNIEFTTLKDSLENLEIVFDIEI